MNHKFISKVLAIIGFIIVMLALGVVGGCRTLVEDRSSSFSLAAGNRTAILGGCNQPPQIGWQVCQWERGSVVPPLRLYFLNPGNYAVSDCFNGMMTHGQASQGEEVIIDLARIAPDIERLGFCLLKIDVTERFGDGREVAMAGGFVIELFDRGYIPSPPRSVVAFCRKFGRTTRGRTTSEPCEVQP